MAGRFPTYALQTPYIMQRYVFNAKSITSTRNITRFMHLFFCANYTPAQINRSFAAGCRCIVGRINYTPTRHHAHAPRMCIYLLQGRQRKGIFRYKTAVPKYSWPLCSRQVLLPPSHFAATREGLMHSWCIVGRANHTPAIPCTASI